MQLTAETWPIAASVLNFPPGTPDLDSWHDDALAVLTEVAEAGFTLVDLTDSWVRPGDLTPGQLDALESAAQQAGIGLASVSAIRRSVIDAAHGDDNLAYSHRTLDAAARLGIHTVSFGLHQALTEEQKGLLWFWRKPGHRDSEDPAVRAEAVRRFQELGDHAAELGIVVSLEMYEHTYLGTGDSAARLCEEIGRPNVGLNPDIGNLIRLPEPVEHWRDLLEKTLPYTNFWHVKSYSRDEDPVTGAVVALPQYMEMGLINYREGVKMAIANGFQGVICVENYGGDGLSVSAANERYLRRILPRTPDYTLGVSRVQQPTLPRPVTA
ncbi:MAG: sugar phosphate isomerase/epimerase family protein [Actinomycetes bacterium]|nr:MAG: xylose isomerase [Actinomycetota bacterium]